MEARIINNMPTTRMRPSMGTKIILEIILIMVLCIGFTNCTYVVSGRTACLYLKDLKEDPNGFLEWQFTLDKDKEFKDTCSNCHTVKITIDIDRWEMKFASRDSIPQAYFLTPPGERRKFAKENAIFNMGGWNASGRGEIYRIDILRDSLPIQIPFLDYGTYTWGSKNFHFKTYEDCLIPLRIVAKTDTFFTAIRIESDTLIMENMCNKKKKQRKGVYLNPLAWPRMIITSIKGRRLERKKNKDI